MLFRCCCVCKNWRWTRKGDRKIYVGAKIFDQQGCIAYLCKTPNEARCLPGTLEALRADGVQIVILDSPEIYSEYAPYTYMEDMKEFIDKVTLLNHASWPLICSDYYLTTILSVTEKTAMNYCAATVHSCFTYRHILCVIHENLPKCTRFVYGHITPTYAARRVSEIRKRLKALAERAAKTKKAIRL